MLVYIIRHGETNLNVQGRLQGRYDEPLNKNGIALGKETGEALKGIPFDYLFTSPLKRAKRTGELCIAPSAKLFHKRPKKILMDGLMEMSFGEWEGLGSRSRNYEIPVPFEEFNRFFTDPFAFRPHGGETIREMIERTDAALQSILTDPKLQDKIIMVSTHGCALRGMLNRFYEDRHDFWQGVTPYNCSINVIRVEKGKQELIARDLVLYDRSRIVDHYKLDG